MDPLTSKGLWLLSTRNRATTNLPRVLRSAEQAGMVTPGYVVVDSDDYEANKDAYDNVEMPANWEIMIVPGGCLVDALEQARERVFRQYPDLEWLGFFADDHTFETTQWDQHVIRALNGWNVISTDDGAMAPKKMEGVFCWSADLVRAVGYLFPPGLKHMYLDDVWEDIGRATHCWQVLMDVLVRHDHVLFRKGKKDATTKHTESFWVTDERAYHEWRHTRFHQAVSRVIELMKSKGVEVIRPDLSGVKLLIATPCMSGRYEGCFMKSMLRTVPLLKEWGADVEFYDLPYCSDPALGRSKLLGSFYRSHYTHMLQIDDDMGWSPRDIARLLMFKREFVAASGVKKTDPLSPDPPTFTINMIEEDGSDMPIRQERHTGLLSVSNVGGAFVLITRSVVERLIEAYPELQFDTPEGRVEYGLYTPLVVNRRYMSEDFAFCYRWRKIGGHVHVLPDIRLKHVGSYTWEAALIEGFEAELREVPEKLAAE